MEKYNGWTNYDTWNIFTILSNDECRYLSAISAQTIKELQEVATGIEFDITPNWNEILEGFKEAGDE